VRPVATVNCAELLSSVRVFCYRSQDGSYRLQTVRMQQLHRHDHALQHQENACCRHRRVYRVGQKMWYLLCIALHCTRGIRYHFFITRSGITFLAHPVDVDVVDVLARLSTSLCQLRKWLLINVSLYFSLNLLSKPHYGFQFLIVWARKLYTIARWHCQF